MNYLFMLMGKQVIFVADIILIITMEIRVEIKLTHL